MVTTVGSLILELGLDQSSYQRSMAEARRDAEKFMLEMQRQRLELNIKPTVDHKPLVELNQHINLKEAHIDKLNRKVIKPKIDFSDLNKLEARLTRLQNQQIQIALRSASSVPASTIRQAEKAQSVVAKIDQSQADRLGNTIAKSIGGELSKVLQSRSISDGFKSVLSAPINIAKNVLGSIGNALIESIVAPIGNEIGTGIKEGIQASTGDIIGSFRLVSREIAAGLSDELVKAIGEDAPLIAQIFEDILGKQTIAVENLSRRYQQQQQQQQRSTQAQQQAQQDFKQFQQQSPQLKERAGSIDNARSALAKQQQELESKLTAAREQAGIPQLLESQSQLQSRLESTSKRRMEALERGESTATIEAEFEALIAQSKVLSNRINTVNEGIEQRFKQQADRLKDYSDRLAAAEFQFAREMRPVEQMELLNVQAVSAQSKAAQRRSQPQSMYEQIANQTIERSGLDASKANLPQLIASDNLRSGTFGQYNPNNNTIEVSRDAKALIDAGKLSAQQIETLVHEVRHAVQLDFGKLSPVDKANIELIKPNRDETRQFGRRIERSVEVAAPGTEKQVRALEADAYTFASRNAAEIGASITQKNAIEQFESAFGVGGSKAELNTIQAQKAAISQLMEIKKAAENYGIDVSDIMNESLSDLSNLEASIEPLLQMAASIEGLTTEQIQKLGSILESNIKKSIDTATAIPAQVQSRVDALIAELSANQSAASSTSIESPQPLEGIAEFKQMLDEQYSAKGLTDVVKRLGIPNASKRSKADLIELIAKLDRDSVDAMLDSLGDSIKKKSFQSGSASALPSLENEAEVLAQIKETDQRIRDAVKQVQSANGQQRSDLLQFIQTEALTQQAEIDRLVKEYQLSGKTAQSLAGYRSQADQLLNPSASELAANNPAKTSLSQSGAVSAPSVEQLSKSGGSLAAFEDIKAEVLRMTAELLGNATDPEVAAAEALAAAEKHLLEFQKAENQINKSAESSSLAVEQLAQQAGGQETLLSRLSLLLRSNSEDLDGFAASAIGMVKSGLSILTLAALAPVLIGLGNSAINAATEFGRFEQRLSFSSGGMEQAKQRISELRSESNRLGTDLKTTIATYSQFAASTKGTNLEGVATEQIFSGVSQAASVQQLDPQRQELVFGALSQMASKSVISMEELRQQLGESLPGAMNTAARAMGMTTQEFNKLVESGGLMADEFLPKFAQQLAAESIVAMGDAANSSQANINRLNNSIYALQVTAGKELMPIRDAGLKAALVGVQALQAALPLLIQLLIAVGLKGASSMLGIGMAALKAQGGIGGLRAGLEIAGKAAKGMIAAYAPFIAVSLAITAAMDTYKLATQDAGRETKQFAEEATKGLAKYLELTGRTTEALQLLGKTASNVQLNNQNNEGILENTIIGGAARTVGGLFGRDANEVNDRIRGFERGFSSFTGMNTVGDVRADQRAQGSDALLAITNRTQSEALSMFNVNTGAAMGDLARMQEIDKQLRELQARQAALSDGDSEGRRAIMAQREALLKESEQTGASVRTLQESNAAQIEMLKADKEGLEKELARTDLSPSIRAQTEMRLAAVNDSLESAVSLSDRFAKNITNVNTAAKLLATSLAAIDANLERSNQQINLEAASSRESTARQQLTGITDGQAAFRSFAAGQETLGDQIEANRTALSALRAELNDTAISDAMSVAGLNSNSTPTQIRTRAGDFESAPETKAALEQAAERYERISTLELETANLSADMAEAQVDAQQQLQDSSKAIADFYRDIERNAQEIQAQAKSSQIDSAASTARAKLTRALSGFSNTFFDDFVNGLADLLDQMFEPLRIAQQAMQQRMSVNNQLQDLTRQATELRNGLTPMTGESFAGGAIAAATGGGGTGRTTRFEGIQVTSAVDASGEPGLDYVVANGRRGAEFGAVAAGEVIRTVTDQNWENNMGRGESGSRNGRRGYGNQVIIRARDAVTGQFVDMLYAHLDSVAVQVGQQVGVGTVLGTQGRTGSTTGAHVSLDFFAPGSRQTNSAALNMRNRTARELSSGARNFNAAIQTPQATPIAAPAAPRPQAPAQRYAPRGGTLSRAERVQRDPSGAAAMAATAQRLQLPLNEFAALMSWESGGTLNPNVIGGDGNRYQGLIQFSPDNQQRYGIRPGMSIAEQMPAIERYLLDRGFQPGQMDIRGAYSAVLAGNANQRYWNRRDSNGTSVNNAASKFQGGDHYERAQQFLRDSGVTDNGATSPASPSAAAAQQYGSPGSNAGAQLGNAQIDAGLTTAQQSAQQQFALIDQTAAAQTDAASANLQQSIQQAKDGLARSLEQLQDQTTATRQQQEQQAYGLLGDSPIAQRLQQGLQRSQEFENANRDLVRNVERSERTIAALQTSRTEIMEAIEQGQAMGVDEGTLNQYRSLLPNLEATIAANETELQNFESLLEDRKELFDAANEQSQREIQQQRQQERGEGLRQTMTLQLQRRSALEGFNRNEIGSQVIDQRLSVASIAQSYQDQIEPLQRDLADFQARLEELRERGIELNDDQLQQVQGEIDYTQEKINRLTENRDIEIDISQINFDQTFRQLQDDLQSSLVESGATYLEGRNDTFGANQLRETYAVTQEQQRFDSQMAGLDSLEEAMPERAAEIAEMRNQMTMLNELNLENIDTQFRDLGETLADIGQESLGTFFQDILSGSKSAGEAFKDLIGNILNQLAQLAVNSLLKDLFGGGGGLGGLFGSGQQQGSGIGNALGGLFGAGQSTASASGGSGGTGGFLGALFNIGTSLIGGFAEGGVIASANHDAYRNGYGAISDALKREGTQAVLAALTPGERILTIEQNRKYESLGLDRVLNFKDGGVVGGDRPMPNMQNGTQGSNTTIHIPINISGESESNFDAAAMDRVVRSSVTQELLRQKRQSGILRS